MSDSRPDESNEGLTGRVAIVTGASRGIGRAIALELARRAVRVYALARDHAALDELAERMGGIESTPLDITDDAAVDGLLASLRESSAGVDLLVHCAGGLVHSRTSEASMRDLDEMLSLNLRAAYRLTQGLLPALVENSGDVVFVNSSTVHFPRAHSGQYAATQHALAGFANSLREELNPEGVRVLSVFPGKTATALQERLHAEAGETYRPQIMLQPEDVADVVVGALALPRRAEVTEIRVRPALRDPGGVAR